MLIDVHAHLEDEAFLPDLDDVIGRAKSRGVGAIVTSGLGLSGIKKGAEISRKYGGYVFLTAGMAPAEVDENYPETIQLIKEMKDEIVGVGEVGLDFYHAGERELLQKQAFGDFIELAGELQLPIVVHSRQAGKEALSMLFRHGAKNVLMHAFDGSPSDALEGAKMGYLYSIPTSIARSRQKQRLVEVLPMENLAVETDSPVLGPVVGERNEPANLPLVAEKIAEIKKLPFDKVAEITTQNALRLFGRIKA